MTIKTKKQYDRAMMKIMELRDQIETLQNLRRDFEANAITRTKIVQKEPTQNQSWKYEIKFGKRKVIAAKTKGKGVVVTEGGKVISQCEYFTLNDVRHVIATGVL